MKMKILNKIQHELKAPKGQFNAFGKYKYRSCEDILEAVKPLLETAILVITDEIVHIGDRYYVKATATISEGEESMSSVAFAREPENKKGMDESQITGAASSYARKYAANGLFCIDDTKDADADIKTEPLKPLAARKPTDESGKVLDTICEILEKKTNLPVIKKTVGAIFLSELGAYPSKPENVQGAAAWLISLNRQDEWTIAPDNNMTNVMKNIDQAFFNFETEHADFLADYDGNAIFSKDKFVRLATKDGLPIRKTAAEIAALIEPKNVIEMTKEN